MYRQFYNLRSMFTRLPWPTTKANLASWIINLTQRRMGPHRGVSKQLRRLLSARPGFRPHLTAWSADGLLSICFRCDDRYLEEQQAASRNDGARRPGITSPAHRLQAPARTTMRAAPARLAAGPAENSSAVASVKPGAPTTHARITSAGRRPRPAPRARGTNGRLDARATLLDDLRSDLGVRPH